MTLAALKYTPAPGETFRFTPGEMRVFRIPEKISTAEWAARHRTVVDGGRKSPWRNELSPCAYGIMDALDLPYVREVYVQAPPQTVKTQAIINYLMRCIDQRPTSAMLVMPDEKLTRRVMRRRIVPSVKASPRTAAVISHRADDTTNLSVAFTNGMDIIGAWAGSASALSSDAMELMILDEMNKYPAPTGAEPNGFILARARTNSFPFTHKIYGGSTPTDETGLLSQVIRERSDEIRYYFAKCPICGEEQRMLWENISWGKCRDPREILRKKLARYYCSACGMAWDDTMRDRAVLSQMKKGWRPDPKENKDNAAPIERPRAIAFKLQSWYVQSMSESAASFVEGQDDQEKLKAWVTQHAAEDWKLTIVPKKESIILSHRTELPPLIVPAGAVALTAGFDHQKLGFWYVVRAWADDLTSWLIDYGYLTSYGDVETLIWRAAYRIEGSQNTMDIWRAGIDTGGGLLEEGGDDETTMSEEVYQWLRLQPPVGFAANGFPVFRIFGTKGGSYTSAMNVKRIKESRIDTMPHSKKPIPGGLDLRILDTNQYKSLLHWRLERKGEETQQFYLHSETGEDYARQLLAEEYGIDPRRKGKRCWKKRKGYTANHLLDCFDPETELLTKDGWIFVPDARDEYEFATVELETDLIEYQKPTRLISRRHAGEMIHMNGRRAEFMVTPNHRMIVYNKKFQGNKATGKWSFDTTPSVVMAKDLTIWDRVKCTASWRGEARDKITFPETHKNQPLPPHEMYCIRRTPYGKWRVDIKRNGITKCKSFGDLNQAKEYRDNEMEKIIILEPERTVNATDWAEFLGWYVSEGHRYNRSQSYVTGISQQPGEKQEMIINLLARLPWQWKMWGQGNQRRQLTTRSKQLYEALSEIGIGSAKKCVPRWVKDSDPEIIKAFLDAAILGDGWIEKSGFRTYATVSRKLADDIQELFIKIGCASNIKTVPAKPIKLRGTLSHNTIDQYHATECKTKTIHLRDGKNNPNFHPVSYDGMVYCVSVPNGTLICRRNGRVFIAGNCEVIAAACADSQWQPSLQMLAPYMRNERQRAQQPKTTGEAKPRVARSNWMNRSR